MKKILPGFGALLVLAFLFCTAMPLRADDYQPHMRAALEKLQEAEGAGDPIPLLKQARWELDKASHNKSGGRVEGIDLVDEAIHLSKKGEHMKAADKTNHAIAAVHFGMRHEMGR